MAGFTHGGKWPLLNWSFLFCCEASKLVNWFSNFLLPVLRFNKYHMEVLKLFVYQFHWTWLPNIFLKFVVSLSASSTSETGKQKAWRPPCGIYWHVQQVTESWKINSPILRLHSKTKKIKFNWGHFPPSVNPAICEQTKPKPYLKVSWHEIFFFWIMVMNCMYNNLNYLIYPC